MINNLLGKESGTKISLLIFVSHYGGKTAGEETEQRNHVDVILCIHCNVVKRHT